MTEKTKYFVFGPFRLGLAKQLLLKGQRPVPLAPKAFEILLNLVENSHRLVTRDELMKAIWPDSFVEEANLTVNVSLLRKALGDMPDGQPYIETVPRKGYRFKAEVKEIQEDGPRDELLPPAESPAPAAEEPQLRPANAQEAAIQAPPAVEVAPAGPSDSSATLGAARPVTSRPKALIAAVALVLIAVAWLYLGSKRKLGPTEVQASVPSLAVLPFRALGPDSNDTYLGLGMVDALITRLGNVHQVLVRPLGSVSKYVAAEGDPIAAGRQLGVETVLEGSIQRSGERTRVTVRLLRVSDSAVLWGKEFDEKLDDMFGVEDSISAKVAEALALRLTGDEQEKLSRPYTENGEAYQLYLKGRYAWNKRTGEALAESVRYFDEAIQKDPHYALAYAGLADSYDLMGSYGHGPLPPGEAALKAKAAAEKALSIDDSLAQAHASLGYTKVSYDWDWPGAEAAFKRALTLNPGYATAYHWYSHYLVAMGETEQSLAASQQALRISPADVVLTEHLGWNYMMARQYGRAVEECRKALEMNPNFAQAYRVLGQAYEDAGQYAEAITDFQKAAELSPNDPVPQALLARAYALSGKQDEAKKMLESVKNDSEQKYVSPADIAGIYAALGMKDRAFQWLGRAYAERSSSLAYLKVDPEWDSIRADPRFHDLLRRLNLLG